MTFKTQTGSIYEVDGKKIRRSGPAPAYKHRISGEEWVEFQDISQVEVGLRVVVLFPGDRGTITSAVVEVNQ